MNEPDFSSVMEWANLLQGFIHKATHWTIESCSKLRGQGAIHTEWSVFESDITSARSVYDRFKIGLANELDRVPHSEHRGIEIKNSFLPMIDRYISWYEQHRRHIESWGEYNPYKLMHDIIEATRDTILSHFPDEHENSKNKKAREVKTAKNPTYMQLALKYWYQQKVKTVEYFDNWPDGRVDAYKKVCEDWERTKPTAWKCFQNHYLKIENREKDRKAKLNSTHNGKIVLELLKDDTKAKQAAKQDLDETKT